MNGEEEFNCVHVLYVYGSCYNSRRDIDKSSGELRLPQKVDIEEVPALHFAITAVCVVLTHDPEIVHDQLQAQAPERMTQNHAMNGPMNKCLLL